MFCSSCGKEIPDHSKYCLHCGKAASGGTKEEGTSAMKWFLIGALVLLVILIGGLYVGVMRESGGSGLPPIAAGLQPVSEKLVSGQTVVPAGKHFFVRFRIDPSTMRNARVVGSFHTSGGSGNDIQAVVVEETEWENWINGHKARVLYSTEKITNGKIDVPIAQEGTYYLGFNNSFSLISEKYVFAEIELRYDRPR